MEHGYKRAWLRAVREGDPLTASSTVQWKREVATGAARDRHQPSYRVVMGPRVPLGAGEELVIGPPVGVFFTAV